MVKFYTGDECGMVPQFMGMAIKTDDFIHGFAPLLVGYFQRQTIPEWCVNKNDSYIFIPTLAS